MRLLVVVIAVKDVPGHARATNTCKYGFLDSGLEKHLVKIAHLHFSGKTCDITTWIIVQSIYGFQGWRNFILLAEAI